MRIAVWHNLPSGGGKRALRDLVKGLVSRGHMVESWAPSCADVEFQSLSPDAEEHVVPIAPAAREPHPLLRHLTGSHFRVGWNIQAMNAAAIAASNEIRAGQFDILFAHSCSWFAAPPIARYVPLPSVLYLQEPMRVLYEARPLQPWVADCPEAELSQLRMYQHFFASGARLFDAKRRAFEEQKNAKAFNRILVNSYFSKESVLRAYGATSSVSYLGIETSVFRDLALSRERIAVSVGEFAEHKRPDFIIRAIGRSRTRPALVWIANRVETELEPRMRDLAISLGVELVIKTRVSDGELTDTLNRARVFLYAPRLEPFGLAPLEAAACGLTTIAVAEGGVRETVRHMETGILIDDDPSAMAGAIDSLFEDALLAERLGAQAADSVRRNWTLDAAVDRLEVNLKHVASHLSATSGRAGGS